MENKLRATGSSLERERQAFLESALARDWLLQKVKVNKEVSDEEADRYYHDHPKEFEHPARARWEELMTRISNYRSQAAAFDALVQMGNAVRDGASFAEIAKSRSDGLTASKGGIRDWTNQGSLVDVEMDRALFGLPVGTLSKIIEDKMGFHIIRVIEREGISRTPYTLAQVKIRAKIKEQWNKTETSAYIERLREQTPIWIASDLSVGLIPLVKLDAPGEDPSAVKPAAEPGPGTSVAPGSAP
jgi:hypothetical protein